MKYIAILRGINVGGKRKILMADLKAMFQKMGFTDLSTYIQSGNIIFHSDKNRKPQELSKEIQHEIANTFGFEVPVIIRTPEQISLAIQSNPFYSSEEDIPHLHLTFLGDSPSTENIISTESYSFEPDRFVLDGDSVYVYCEGKYHESKLSNNFFEKKLGVPATTRNWKTVLKLGELGMK